jgi:hypothetical protein
MVSRHFDETPRLTTGGMQIVTKPLFWLLAIVGSLTTLGVACSEDSAEVASTQTGGNGSGASAAGGNTGGNVGGNLGGNAVGGNLGGNANGGAGAGIPPAPTELAPCGSQLYDCGDLVDNDGDGLIDYQDPDCLGPCDNTEDSYYPDLPGMSGQDCDLDCFWDTGQGHNWNCYWDHQCDPLADTTNNPIYPQEQCAWDSGADGPVGGQSFPPSPLTCDESFNSQPQDCLDQCKPLAPNGCDCFGCCELEPGVTVWLATVDAGTNAGTCTIDAVGQPDFFDKCAPCTQVPGCNNTCEVCEICINKPVLPPECFPGGQGGGGQGAGGGGQGGAPQTCPVGQDACGLAGQALCPGGFYCITGCCVPLPQ